MRKTSMVPVVSDFLFDNVDLLFRDLVHLNSVHDVFVALVDASFAFELPTISAGWVEAFDVESGPLARDVAARAAPDGAARAGMAG